MEEIHFGRWGVIGLCGGIDLLIVASTACGLCGRWVGKVGDEEVQLGRVRMGCGLCKGGGVFMNEWASKLFVVVFDKNRDV